MAKDTDDAVLDQTLVTKEGLKNRMTKLAERLLELVPAECADFIAGTFYDFKQSGIESILEYTLSKAGCFNQEIKDSADFGFESMADAEEKLELLKKAWEGIIDVEIIPVGQGSEGRVNVEFKMQIENPVRMEIRCRQHGYVLDSAEDQRVRPEGEA